MCTALVMIIILIYLLYTRYDRLQDIIYYIQRIGRTGRSKSNGTAYTLFTDENGAHASDLVDVLREAKQEVDPGLIEISKIRYGRKN